MGKKGLTTEEKESIKLLSAKGESCYAISLQVKRSPHTIKNYLSEPETSLEIIEKKQELSDMFEDVARRMIESITDESIQSLDAYKKTISAGIATDKMRLLRDQSTDNLGIAVICDLAAKIRTQRRAINLPAANQVIEESGGNPE